MFFYFMQYKYLLIWYKLHWMKIVIKMEEKGKWRLRLLTWYQTLEDHFLIFFLVFVQQSNGDSFCLSTFQVRILRMKWACDDVSSYPSSTGWCLWDSPLSLAWNQKWVAAHVRWQLYISADSIVWEFLSDGLTLLMILIWEVKWSMKERQSLPSPQPGPPSPTSSCILH